MPAGRGAGVPKSRRRGTMGAPTRSTRRVLPGSASAVSCPVRPMSESDANESQPDERQQVVPAARGEGERRKEAGVELDLPESSETLALIERAKSGDAEALNELFSQHHGLMVEL